MIALLLIKFESNSMLVRVIYHKKKLTWNFYLIVFPIFWLYKLSSKLVVHWWVVLDKKTWKTAHMLHTKWQNESTGAACLERWPAASLLPKNYGIFFHYIATSFRHIRSVLVFHLSCFFTACAMSFLHMIFFCNNRNLFNFKGIWMRPRWF